MIAVLDTNVWISALVRPLSPPGRVLDAFLLGSHSVATTERLWNELLRALSYDRVQRLFTSAGESGTPQKRFSHLRGLVTFVPEVAPRERWVAADPDDDWVIECALTAGAEYIVTGDRALRNLQTIQSVNIVTAREYLSILAPPP